MKQNKARSPYDQGYYMAGIKQGKAPICPFLQGTVGYREWFSGWNTRVLDDAVNKEKQNAS